ncbi:flavoprotein [Nonomuraea sp. 10N515B]|uniref:flavoprotein n=1 Tax=Nonomuraea sp. 10N515B TaxID=3457422 RepID=UPI003FCD9524
MKLPAPAFGAQRLLLVGTGAVSVMHLPFWLNWLSGTYPDLELQVVLTPSAERFVSGHAVSVLTGRPCVRDRWPEEQQTDALHVRLMEWSDSMIVFPACLNFISRLSTGLADTPALLALQCSTGPIGIAPSVPPGAEQNPVYTANLRRLEERPNVVIAPTQAAVSVTTGRRDAAGASPLWVLVEALESLRLALAESQGEACSN